MTPNSFSIEITLSDGTQKGKLADAALQILTGELAGIEVVGFTVWEGRNGPNVTFPARKFAGRDGKERSFSYVRSSKRGQATGMSNLRTRILAAYDAAVTEANADAPTEHAEPSEASR